MTGSCNVITLNLNRITQDYFRTVDTNYFGASGILYQDITKEDMEGFKKYLIDILERVYKYHIAFKTMLYEVEEKGMLTSSTAGYISMNKLFSTIGLNGLNEAAEFLGLTIPDPDLKWNEERQHYDFGQLPWDEFMEILKGNGPCNKKRIETKRKAQRENSWVKEAAAAFAEKQQKEVI